jgi:hypothetical protein
MARKNVLRNLGEFGIRTVCIMEPQSQDNSYYREQDTGTSKYHTRR